MIYTIRRLYGIWRGMKTRCYGRKLGHKHFRNYTQRGIVVCDEWRNDFKAFERWALANGYRENLQIDRFPNNDGNYEPSNCRWATPEEQANNTRRHTPEVLSHLTSVRPFPNVPVMRLDTGEVFPTKAAAGVAIKGNPNAGCGLLKHIDKHHRFGGGYWVRAMPEWLLGFKPCAGWECYQ